MLKRVLSIGFLAASFLTASVVAAPFDASFATNGIYTAGLTCCGRTASAAMARQPDGKVVVTGFAVEGTRPVAVLVRYNADGSLDTGFASGGTFRIDLAPSDGNGTYGAGVAVQADGKILLAGNAHNNSNVPVGFVARVSGAGVLDNTYGVDGVRTFGALPAGAHFAGLADIAVQADGTAIAAGTLRLADRVPVDLFAVRLDATGALDSTFGTAGFARSGHPTGGEARALALGPAGEIVVAGNVRDADAVTSAAVMRLLPSGAGDTGFDGDGLAIIPPSAGDVVYRVAVRADGRILVASYNRLAQLTTAGALDTSYNGNGITPLPSGSFFPHAMAIGNDGFDYVAIPNLVRYPSIGGPVSAGFIYVDSSTPTDLLVDGSNLYIAGTAGGVYAVTDNDEIRVTKLLPAGTPDLSYGAAGLARHQPGRQSAPGFFKALHVSGTGVITAIQPDSCGPGTDWRYRNCARVVRLLANGAPDPTLTTPVVYGVAPTTRSVTGHMDVRADGKILYTFVQNGVAGERMWSVVRLLADGTVDSTFAAPLVFGENPPIWGITGLVRAYADGRTLFATPTRMTRLLDNGAIDPAFNSGTPIVGTWVDAAIAGDGGVIHARSDTVQRLTPDGLVDVAFGSGGAIVLGGGRTVNRIVVLPGGAILVAGTQTSIPFVQRYSAAGVLDTTFGASGQAMVHGFFGATLTGLAVDSQGRIVVAGRNIVQASSLFAARFTPQGQLDPGIGAGGFSTFDGGPDVEAAETLAIMPDDRPLFGGSLQAGSPVVETPAIMKAGAAPLTYSSAIPTIAGVGRPFLHQLLPGGGTPPYTFTLMTGTLPPGLALSNTAIDGTPTIAGTYNFTLRLLDSASTLGVGSFSIVVHDTASLVDSYYQTILGRPSDPSGQGYWQGEAARLTGLGVSINEVFYALASQFFASPEYTSANPAVGDFLNDLYGTFFNRVGDPGGLGYWTSQLISGKPRGAVLNDFLFSTEFAGYMSRIFGTATSSRPEVSMVMDFYRGLLARLPETTAVEFWIGRFRQAQCNGNVYAEVNEISSTFLNGNEYAARQMALPTPQARDAAYVVDLYNAFLKRGGDLAGVQYWIARVGTAAGREEARLAFLASPEFTARVEAVRAAGCLP